MKAIENECSIRYAHGLYYVESSKDGNLATTWSKERAEMICRAVNCHEELIEALRDLLDVCPCKNGCKPDDMTCATQKAKAALKKSESK